MQENDQILETPIQDEESFRTAVLDFLEGNCERVNESESSLEDGSERVKECRNFQKELQPLGSAQIALVYLWQQQHIHQRGPNGLMSLLNISTAIVIFLIERLMRSPA